MNKRENIPEKMRKCRRTCNFSYEAENFFEVVLEKQLNYVGWK